MAFSPTVKLIKYLKYNWIQIILINLAIYDLRVDIRILFDFFTFTSLIYTISQHPLAITVLIAIPNFLIPFKKE